MSGLIIDIGFGTVAKRTAQNYADATAMSATRAIADNTTLTPKTDQYVANAISDVITAAGVSSSKLNITSPSGVTSSIGTVSIVAQYLDQDGNALNPAAYVGNDALPLSLSADGVRVQVATTNRTFFGGAVNINTITVSAGAAAIGKHVIVPGVIGLNPFAARWDPPFGADTAQAYSNAVSPANMCTTPSYAPSGQCYNLNGSDPLWLDTNSGGSTDDLQWWAIATGHPTSFILFGNGTAWQRANTGTGDNDWMSGSASFKGFFDDGLQNDCSTNNRGQFSGQGVANGRAPTVNPAQVGYFPLIDWTAANGSNYVGNIYGVVALVVTGTSPLTGEVVPQTGSWVPDTACGQVQLDPTGKSQFIAPFMIE